MKTWGWYDYIAIASPSAEFLRVSLSADVDLVTQQLFESLKYSINSGHSQHRESGRLITSLEIEVTQIREHPAAEDLTTGHHGWAFLKGLLSKHGTRASAIEPAWMVWNWDTVPTLAKLIRAERKFELLPILADALEEAGCTDAEMLDHLRAGLPHTDNCWVLDLILGKPA